MAPIWPLALGLLCSVGPQFGSAEYVNPLWNTIWAYYRYPMGPSAFVELNIRTWRKHNPGMKVVLVNETNIMEYVPDLPKEFFKLPYDQCKSDVLRAAVLYHHGGLYMDTDFLVMKSLKPILDKLESNDIVSYSDGGRTEAQVCGKQFSSNWHAGRKGNAFSAIWWENTKTLLKRQCDKGDFANNVEKTCCHEVDAPHKDKTQCHIPWANLEHLKTPLQWAQKNPDDAKLIKQLPEGMKLFCLHGAVSLTPHRNGEIFWSPWDPILKKTIWNDPNVPWEIAHYKGNCTEDTATGDVSCGRVTTKRGHIPPRTYEKLFDRPAYHLFGSTHTSSANHARDPENVLQYRWLLSEMYRRSLGIPYRGHDAGRY